MSHKDNFEQFLHEFTKKRNSSLMEDKDYDQIIQYIISKKDNPAANGPIIASKNKLRIKRQQYYLVNYPDLNISNILVVSDPEV